MQVRKASKETFRFLSVYIYCAVVYLVLLHTAHARLTLEDIKALQEVPISNNPNLLVNPKESLNLLRGYLFYKNGFMYNKRLYSPEINIEYSLEVDPNSASQDSFIYTRTPCNDTVYPVKDKENEKESMLYAYHEKLLQLFPSAYGELSIEATKPDAFVNFLRAKSIKKHTYSILASLFLLAEGVDVPIECVENSSDDEELVLRKHKGGDEYFRLSTTVSVYNPEKGCAEDIHQSEAVDIINFFIKNRQKAPEPAPGRMEEFQKGEFLDSVPFLIQAYIFEFIDTQDGATSFINAVHTILSNLASSEPKTQTSAESVIERLFTKKRLPEEDPRSWKFEFSTNVSIATSGYFNIKGCFQTLTDLQSVLEEQFKHFPFVYPAQLPSYMNIQQNNSFVNRLGREKYYDNSTEVHLYTLFCCLLKDPETKKISVDKLSGESSRLKKFFEKYPRAVESLTTQMHQDWSEVFVDLKAKGIAYTHEKNEICPGILNILRVICEISGLPKDNEEVLEVAKLTKQWQEQKNLEDFYSHLKSTICSLLRYKIARAFYNVEIYCKSFEKGTRQDGMDDIYGEIIVKNYGYRRVEIDLICVKYPVDYPGWGVLFKISPKGISSTLLENKNVLSDDEKILVLQAQQNYTHAKTFMDCLILQYIDNIVYTYNTSFNSTYKDAQTKKISEHDSNNPNSIFLYGPIRNQNYKIVLIYYLLKKLRKSKLALTPDHPAIRCSSNILGSVALDGMYSRFRFLSLLRYPEDYISLYPNIKLTQEVYNEEVRSCYGALEVFYYIETKETKFSSILWGDEICLEIFPKIMSIDDISAVWSDFLLDIFNRLFEDNTITPFVRIIKTIEYEHTGYISPLTYTLNGVFFALACTKKKDHPEFLMDLFKYYKSYDRNDVGAFPYKMAKKSNSKWINLCRNNANSVVTFFNNQVLPNPNNMPDFEADLLFFTELGNGNEDIF